MAAGGGSSQALGVGSAPMALPLKSLRRSTMAVFAPMSNLIAAGTSEGAIDLLGSVEFFKLDFSSLDQEPQLLGSCPTGEALNRLAWGAPGLGLDGYPYGVVAGGLSNGSIMLWNPATVISEYDSGVDDPLLARLEKHTGEVQGLEFNPISPNKLASGGDDGNLYIWDLEDPTSPSCYPPLRGPGSQERISFLSWNRKHEFILATTSYNGTFVVWDLRQQKPLRSFSDPTYKKHYSALQWHPETATCLIVATDDQNSALQTWDLRQSRAPVKQLVGHNQGVLSLAWCPNDSSLLLSCGKDGTRCWDTDTGEILAQLPKSNNWNSDVQWSSRTPGVFSTSSSDGGIGIYNIETCRALPITTDFGQSMGGSQLTAPLKAPKWLKRPVGVSFGFGGKIVTLKNDFTKQTPGTPAVPEVHIHSLMTEEGLVNRSTEFEATIAANEKPSMRKFCDQKASTSKTEDEREIWHFLKFMLEDDARRKLVAHLGFAVSEGGDIPSDKVLTDGKQGSIDVRPEIASGTDENSFQLIDDGEDFFDNLQNTSEEPRENLSVESSQPTEEMYFEEAAVQPSRELEKELQNALIVCDFKAAVDCCFKANRMGDALLLAHAGGSELWEKTQNEYMRRNPWSYLKVAAAIVSNDLKGLVESRPLTLWKETLALLSTYAQSDDWTQLCDTLAAKLYGSGDTQAAILCYICAGNIEKVVDIWSHALNGANDGRNFVDCLQDLMEKIVILGLANEQRQISSSLASLIGKYAELLASQGLLTTAMAYLSLVPAEESSHDLAVLRDRICKSGIVNGSSAKPPFPSDSATSSGSQAANGGYMDDSVVTPASSYVEPPGQQQPQEYYQGATTAAYNIYKPPGDVGTFVPSVSTYASQQPTMFYQPDPSYSQIPSQQPSVMTPFAPPSGQVQFPGFVPRPPPSMDPYQSRPPAGPYPGAPSYAPNLAANENPSVPSFMLPGTAAPSTLPPRGFTPITPPMPQLPQGPLSPPHVPLNTMPSSPVMTPSPAVAPPAPPPTVQNVDTSNVAAEIKPVIATLTRLFNETTEALGGIRANPAKRREVEDNSRKLGSLFAKLNAADISPNASTKLVQLCRSLDSGDYNTALQIQIQLTTSDWDECSHWLAALKRMIKTRQTMR